MQSAERNFLNKIWISGFILTKTHRIFISELNCFLNPKMPTDEIRFFDNVKRQKVYQFSL